MVAGQTQDDVEVLVAPGIDGELAILPHHAPLLTVLKPGEIRVVKDGEDAYIAVSGGFMEVIGNTVTILADACERSEEINEDRATEAVERAQERLASHPTDLEMERALGSMRRAQMRLDVVRRRRPRAGRPPGSGSPGQGP